MKAYVEPEEVNMMEKVAHYLRDKLLIRFLFRLGCRISEALDLKVENIDFAQRTVTIIHLKTRLKLYCSDCGAMLGVTHVFCPKCGRRIEMGKTEQQEHRRQRVLPVDTDTLMLHFVDEPDDYERVFGSEGLLELALWLKKEGKARFIGLSSHYVPVALKAVNSGHIDVLMFPVNPAFDTLPADMDVEALWQDSSYKEAGAASDKSTPQRRELYHACAIQGVGLVAMKPYAAGRLFVKENPSRIVLTPVQCINYALSQPGVCTVVPGCRTVPEMRTALAFLDAADKEKDYSSIDINSVWKLRGSCMYCNHCLPCPVGIDIGMTIRITDTAKYGTTDSVLSEYEALLSKASDCTECSVCVERCPFDVDIIANMIQAVDIFGK